MVQLWHNQQGGKDLILKGQSAYINHEMGCGKTLTVVDSARELEVCLIFCPVAVGATWEREFARHDPDRRVIVAVSGPVAKRAERVSEALAEGGRLAIVLNYEAVAPATSKPLRTVLEKARRIDAIVLDEAHRIKSPRGKTSKWLAKLANDKHPQAKRICLSGTPTPQSPFDWWSQFRFLDPSILGTNYPAFQRRIATLHPQLNFVLGWNNEGLSALTERIDPYIHRVKSSDVLDLPEELHETIPVTLSKPARRFYNELEKEMVALLDNGETVTAANKLVAVNRLMMATSGYARSEENDQVLQPIAEGLPDKAKALSDWLEDFPRDEPLAIIAVRHVDLDAIAQVLRDHGRSHGELSGRRKELVSWQNGGTDALIVQMQAGNAGIDLTRSCYLIYYSISHSNGDYLQSLARIRRPGQTRCCRYYHLTCTDTIDESIYAALEKKQDIVDAVCEKLTRRMEGVL